MDRGIGEASTTSISSQVYRRDGAEGQDRDDDEMKSTKEQIEVFEAQGEEHGLPPLDKVCMSLCISCISINFNFTTGATCMDFLSFC